MTAKIAKPTGAKLVIQKPTGAKLVLRKTWQPMDSDAAAYITAVETADNQALEEQVKIAIDNFVLGCKADGIWSAIKASCILAGARTLNGALVPLVGPAPTNFHFVSGDYNRKTGLVGDGLSKYLNTNYKISQYTTGKNLHLGLFGTSGLTTGRPMGVFRKSVYTRHYLPIDNTSGGVGWGTITGANVLGSGHYIATWATGQTPARYINGNFELKLNTDDSTPSDHPVGLFCALGSDTGDSAETTETFAFSSARIAFFHVGDGLTASQVSALNGRRADLFTALGSAIP